MPVAPIKHISFRSTFNNKRNGRKYEAPSIQWPDCLCLQLRSFIFVFFSGFQFLCTKWKQRILKMHITFQFENHIIYFLDSKTQKNHYTQPSCSLRSVNGKQRRATVAKFQMQIACDVRWDGRLCSLHRDKWSACGNGYRMVDWCWEEQ